MICGVCGTPSAPAVDKFCIGCGTKLNLYTNVFENIPEDHFATYNLETGKVTDHGTGEEEPLDFLTGLALLRAQSNPRKYQLYGVKATADKPKAQRKPATLKPIKKPPPQPPANLTHRNDYDLSPAFGHVMWILFIIFCILLFFGVIQTD